MLSDVPLEVVNNLRCRPDIPFHCISILSSWPSSARPLASWLRSKLKNYKPPLELWDLLPAHIAKDLFAPREVFLDTAFGRASEDFWNNNILPNLRAFEFLVVVSTPEAFSLRSDGTQNWLVREIDAFLEFGSGCWPDNDSPRARRARGEISWSLATYQSNWILSGRITHPRQRPDKAAGRYGRRPRRGARRCCRAGSGG